MKILIIHHSGILGGGTLSCFDIITALKQNNHNVLLSLPKGENAARFKAQETNTEILNENVSPLIFGYYNGGSNPFKVVIKAALTLKYINKWKKIIEKEKPDIVVLNSIVQWPMIPLLSRMNIKHICFIRETMRGKSKGIINRIISTNLNRATGVAFLSQFDKEQWGLSKGVIQSIIPDTVDVDIFTKGITKENSRKQLNLKSDVFYILYVGGMNELKGARTIIHAIKNCDEKNIKLLFLGDLGTDLLNTKSLSRLKNYNRISFIKEMNKFVQENGLENHIEFAGMQRNMNNWYAACDVVVFPAKEAHQARPIYEAGVFKKPIIASNFPHYQEYLKPGISGLVFEPGNYQELAQAIKKLYLDRELSTKLSENNYIMMEKYHNSIKVNKKISSFIDSVAI